MGIIAILKKVAKALLVIVLAVLAFIGMIIAYVLALLICMDGLRGISWLIWH